MENKYKRISRIENFLSILMAKSGASEHFFVGGKLPQEIAKEWNDMLYVDINPQNDRNAYQNGSVNIYLYSRPTGNFSRKNVKAMDSMEDKMDAAIASVNDPHYTVQVNWRDSDYDKDVGFFYNIINVSIFVK